MGESNKKIIIFLIIILPLFSQFNIINVFATDMVLEKKVLILNSYDHGFKWSNDVSLGVKSVLNKAFKRVNIIEEYMDTNRYNNELYYEKLYELYKYKYSNKKFDVVIVIGNNAYNFANKYYKSLFSATPVVFCGVEQNNFVNVKDRSVFTGVIEKVDIKDTIDTILKLHEYVRYINFIVDKTHNNDKNIETINHLKNYYSDIEFRIIESSTIRDTLSKVKNLSKYDVAFIFPVFMEDENEYDGMLNGINQISKQCPVPIYSAWADYINRGIIGGKLIYGFYHGTVAGQMAEKILKGVHPSDIDVLDKSYSKYVFDYNQLHKFGIDELRLPKGSCIINIPSIKYSISKKIVKNAAAIFIIFLTSIIIFLVSNIKMRKIAENALRASEKRLRILMNTSPDIICFRDDNGRWLEVNKALLKLFDLREEEWQKKTSAELDKFDKYLLPNINDKIIWENARGIRYEKEIFDGTGEKLVFDIYKIPIFYENDSKKAIVTVGHDITYLKRNQELKEKAEQRLRILSEMKEYDNLRKEFFANISHELRTPINIIVSSLQYIDFLQRNDLLFTYKEKVIKYKGIMMQNCYRLLKLINNLIDITKIDSGYFKLNLKNHDIISLVESITLSVVEYAESKDIELIFDTNVEEKIIACDSEKIERIMLNLLSNAIKFTRKNGNILVSVSDKTDYVLISVKDTGIGIPDDKQQYIFKRFAQVDGTHSINKNGSGIGLSLVKALVEMHEGNISVKSEYKKGSEFIIELPAKIIEGGTVKVENVYSANKSNNDNITVEFSDINITDN
ncbi:sensor histidine kinase TodS [Clostridium tepidiprofundi DSM 19306]|uniref:histidine kinase n=1 Tax=Clostridium tepidiprofundi DSM 19306 TaxID=1121338 RepID=A0A151B3B2_9CLOT|nr:ABC transporter substrate binding protein [Clostridium tepidiprofundi]KYH34401.1 sensor histidine kinase TodS [Clostridium tepidiprofundi DSM 19306]